jgi:(2R)-sulfolactate sulfo-lyase subunit alpha
VKHSFLAHCDEDDVAVAVADVEAGQEVVVAWLDGDKQAVLRSLSDVPLGHKIALRDLGEGSPLLKYGIPIGRTTRSVRAGDHVHTHNLKSARW